LTFTKWGGHPHWDGAGLTYRGEDDHGLWLVAEEGTVFSRPGAEFATHGRQVMLLPSIDICTPPAVRVLDDGSGVVSSVDLDLDVVQGFDGSVGVEDEDEFAQHQGRYGYPPEVVDSAATECRRVVADLRSGASWARESLVAAWRSR
jgi:hypothetical protein